jgi:DNA-binding response OmpR family regulator
MSRILLVEDEPEIAEFVKKGFREERFAVDWAPTVEKAMAFAKINVYDCGIFDINLSEGNRNNAQGTAARVAKSEEITGLDICKAVREKGKVFPVIMLSVLRSPEMKIKALNLGADDYLTKPFLFAELLARVRALLRREKIIARPIIEMGDLVMDTMAHTVSRAGKSIPLNRKEFGLLEYFMRNPGTVLTRSMILDHVWDAATDEFTNTVDVHISFLRRKIDNRAKKKKLIRTVHGYGYKFDV